MDNREFAKVLLCEAAELLGNYEETLLEYSNKGQKNMTSINVSKNDVNKMATEREIFDDNTITKLLLKYSDHNAEKALKGDSALLEKIGKRARALQSVYSKKADKEIPNYMKDSNYESFKNGLIDKKPIKDKEEMRKNNIKLGYQIAKTHSDARKIALGDKPETIYDRVNSNKGNKKVQNESIAILLMEASELLTEGAQAEAYKAKKIMNDTKPDKYIRKIVLPYSGDTSIGYTMRTSVGYDTASKDPKYVNDRNIPLNTFVYNDYDKQRGIDRKIANAADKMAEKATGVSKSEYDKAFNNDESLKNIRKRELAADAARRHIRRHDKKAQNESIATLITEAALLLNDED